MSEITVLEAITPSRIGGAEVFVANACEILPKMGARVELFCPAGRPFVDYAAKRGTRATTWRTYGKLDPLTLIRLARLIRSTGADVIHTHLSTASFLGALAAKLVRRPSVAHVHGLNTAAFYTYSGHIIAVSEAVKRHLCSQGVPGGRVSVVHNGVDLARFEPMAMEEARERLGWGQDSPVFGVFGRLSPEKGQRVAIEAMFLLLKDCPNARLVICGAGRDLEDLRTTADSLGIAGSVEFAGFVEDVRGLMSACDAVVVPSIREGFGLAAVEAMALARPVIASNAGGLPEVVESGVTGLLVDPNNPDALAEAMMRVAGDRENALELGRRGRERAEERFEIGRQMGKVLTVLESNAERIRPG